MIDFVVPMFCIDCMVNRMHACIFGENFPKQVRIHFNVKLLNGILKIDFVVPMFCIDCMVNRMHA